jgi:hypothetical protein
LAQPRLQSQPPSESHCNGARSSSRQQTSTARRMTVLDASQVPTSQAM